MTLTVHDESTFTVHNCILRIECAGLAHLWLFMKFLPVVYNIQMKGTVSQIVYIGSRFYFMIKNGKLFVIFFLTFFSIS